MDTPSLKSASLVCKCGARLEYRDEAWRVDEAVAEFGRVHSDRASCAVGDTAKAKHGPSCICVLFSNLGQSCAYWPEVHPLFRREKGGA